MYYTINTAKDHAFAWSFKSKLKLLDAVLLVELINAAAGVNELLLAGVEGVALGADLDGDAGAGRTGLDGGAAGALNNGGLIVGMYSCLHFFISPDHKLP